MPGEILLVDDERVVRNGIRALLLSEGYSVRVARDGEEAIREFSASRPNLIVLDVMMPNMNGYRVCEEVRKLDSRVPIVFLTAKDTDADLVRGLDLGADDYVSKTASDEVLLARIRRALIRESEIPGEEGSAIRLGSTVIDIPKCCAKTSDGEVIALTALELSIVKCLVAAKGSVVSNSDILKYMFGDDYVGDSAIVRVHVMNLRRKLGRDGERIANLPRQGYFLAR